MKERGMTCELLGMKLYKKTAQLHHLKPQFYDRLIKEDFKLLSPFSHGLVEMIALLVHGNKTKVPRLQALLDWIGEFLPEPEHTARDFMDQLRRKE